MTAQRPRASRFQFSLRAVLIVLTLAAIAGWWWQKRFRVERTIRQREVTADGLLQVVERTKTESKRRQGLGDAVLDGPTTVVDAEGKLILEEQWRRGVRHGIYRRWDDAGDLQFECEFERGRLVRLDDIAVAEFMPFAVVADDLNGERILRKLRRDTTFEYWNVPLQEVVEDISFNNFIPIIIDRGGLAEAGVHIQSLMTSSIRRVPLFIALVEMLAPFDLTCVYRYEALWVTTPSSDLHDDEVAPRVITDHASPELLSKLSNPVASFDYFLQPLGTVLEDQGFTNNITIEYDLQDESEQVTLNLKNISLRSALGMLLYTHELRCEAIGDKLVFTEVEGKKPGPKTIPNDLLETPPPANPSSSPFADPTGKGTPQYDPFSRR